MKSIVDERKLDANMRYAYDVGFDEGYATGWDEGYDQGLEDAKEVAKEGDPEEGQTDEA